MTMTVWLYGIIDSYMHDLVTLLNMLFNPMTALFVVEYISIDIQYVARASYIQLGYNIRLVHSVYFRMRF